MPKPPVSPTTGFIPLENMNEIEIEQQGLSARRLDEHIVEIPLTPIKTNTSSGARKEDQSFERSDLNRNQTNATDEGGIFHRNLGRRARKKATGGDSALVEDEGALTTMGRFYEKILNFSIITRYLFYILPLALCFLVVILVGIYVAPDAVIGGDRHDSKNTGVRIKWIFIWLEIVWCSLWISKLFAKTLPLIFQTLVGVVSSSVKKYALVIKSLEVPISLVGWTIASLCSFLPLMTKNPDQIRARDTGIKEWEKRTNLVLVSCFISSLVYLGEKLIIQIVSVDYHRKQFAQRIKTNKENVRFLSRLYDVSRSLFPSYTEFSEEDYVIHQGLAAGLINPTLKSGSATPMRQLLGNLGAVQDKVTSAFGNIAQEVTGNKNVFNPNAAYSIVVEALQRKRSSEALAKRIWMSFVPEGSTALTKEDLLEVMGEEHQAQALDCFASLDKDGNGDVSLEEMIMHVLQVRGERLDVAKSMQDVDNAIRALDSVLSFIVFILVVLAFVVPQQASIGTTIAGFGTLLISLSFVFAVTAQEILGSCIFLFVKHPFDVGDRVDIDDRRFIVEHISLLYSVLMRVDNNKTTQIPNNILNTKWVENVSRSKCMKEDIIIGVNYDTTLEDIEKLKEELTLFVYENNRDFQSDVDVEVVGINELDKLQIRVEIKHKSNFANDSLTLQRRNKFFCALVLMLKKIPIYGAGKGDPSVGEQGKPLYTVAISDDEAQRNIEDAKNAKQAKRWDFETEQQEKEELLKSMDDPPSGKAGFPMATGIDPNVGTAHTYNSSQYDHSRYYDDNNNNNRDRDRDDATTLGRKSSESRRDNLEEVRGLLKRESTRGRRRPIPVAPSTPESSSAQPFLNSRGGPQSPPSQFNSPTENYNPYQNYQPGPQRR